MNGEKATRVTFILASMSNGGAERVVSILSNELINRNFVVQIITVLSDACDYVIDDKIQFDPIKNYSSKNKLLRNYSRIKDIKTKTLSFSPDCIISFLGEINIYSLLACHRLRIPIIVSERNDPANDPEKEWMRKLRNFMYRFADGIVFQTEDAKKYFDNFLKSDIKQKIIFNPIKPNLPYYSNDHSINRFITATRLTPQKNIYLMINALKLTIERGFECYLDIYGRGPLEEELRNYVKECSLSNNVSFKGFSNSIHNEMAKCRAFLISSNYEGISNSMLEALAIGAPVIATDCPVGGAKMFIHNKVNGWIVPVGDVNAFSNAMIEILTSPKTADMCGKNAMGIRSDLEAKKILEQWIGFISEVIDSY